MLHIDHDDMVRLYDLLRAKPPFKRWRLPHSDDVEFHAVPIKGDAQAEHYAVWDASANGGAGADRHVLRLNPKRHRTMFAAMQTMAHEMCHMREYELGYRRVGCHGAMFHKLADQVCKRHGFDRGQF